ncbi:MAG: sugar ABC transporter substrate-binding protein [Deltaproteobacteria bacterium]|nr:sugar ABC transporter substrate-binding protein [Deltaproteobacteria bacterium]
MKRPVLIAVALTLVIALTLPAASVAQEEVTLNWLEWWDPEFSVETMDQLVAGFEEMYPNIKINRTAVPWGNMYENLVTSAQSPTAMYDVVGMEWIWMTGLDKLGLFEDLGPWIAQAPEEWQAQRVPGTAVQWAGMTEMIYWYILPYGLAYNIDMLEAAGVEPPTNWDDFVAAAEALRNEDAGVYGFAISAGQNNSAVYFYLADLMQQLGGHFLDEEGNPNFTSPEGVQAMEMWKEFYDAGLAVPGSLAETHTSTREYFSTGRIAMIWDGPFIGTIAHQVNPDMRVAYAPAWQNETGGYMWSGSGLAMAANSEHKEEAWLFLQYLLSPEVAVMMTEATSIPYGCNVVLDEVLATSEDPILREIPAMLTQDPEYNYFQQPIPEYETTHDTLMLAIQEILAGDKSAQEALDEAAAVWQEEIDKVREE